MSNVGAMIEAVAFIEDHLRAEVTVARVAEAVSYSLYHFCRMFSRVVHHTPYDYLMRRRLSESAHALVETDRRILDIALEFQFNSPETYSRAFRRMFGLQPSRWRKQGDLDPWRLLSPLTAAHIEHANQGAGLQPALMEQGVLRVAGLMILVRRGSDEVLSLWQALARVLENAQWAAGRHFGLAWYPPGWQELGYPYLAGVELDEAAAAEMDGWSLPGPLVVKMLPAARYARFEHRGGLETLGLTREFVYQTWLPRSGLGAGDLLEVQDLGRAPPDLAAGTWGMLVPVRG